jgi:hypothetical protein
MPGPDTRPRSEREPKLPPALLGVGVQHDPDVLDESVLGEPLPELGLVGVERQVPDEHVSARTFEIIFSASSQIRHFEIGISGNFLKFVLFSESEKAAKTEGFKKLKIENR